ncbi:MAG: glycosyltransferase family 4 protein [Planctomycetaceae bacterium]
MKSQRLLFAAPTAYLLSGLAAWLDYVIPGLRERGWDVTLGLVSGPRHHRPEEYLKVHPESQVIRIHCETGTRQGRVSAVRSALREVAADLVVSVNIPDAILAVAEERCAGCHSTRGAVACHGIQADLFSDMRLLGDDLDGVICVNRLAVKLSQVLGTVDEDRCQYAACGTVVPPADEALSRVAGRGVTAARPLTIAWCGRIEQEQKRIFDVLEIARQLDQEGVEFRLKIAGGGPDENSLRRAIADAELEHRFEWMGVLPSAALPDRLYRAADVFLLTSRWETGPIVVWEAMANGCPVVSSRYVGSGQEGALRNENNCLMFDIGHIEGAAKQLRRLAESIDLAKRLSSNAWTLVSTRYSIDSSVNAWDGALREILSAPARDPHVRNSVSTTASGRLDRWLPPAVAEGLRSYLGRRAPDSGPGGEWPHTLGQCPWDEAEFWEIAERLDLPGSRPHEMLAGPGSATC